MGLPLVIGLSVTAYLFDHVATQARHSVAVAVQLTRNSRQLAQDIDNLQRASGQCLVLQDAALCRGVEQAHEAFAHDAEQLQAMPLPPEQLHTLQILGRLEASLYAGVMAPGRGQDGTKVFNALNPQFDAMRHAADRAGSARLAAGAEERPDAAKADRSDQIAGDPAAKPHPLARPHARHHSSGR